MNSILIFGGMVSKAASIVEINGNRYDANTGDVIGSVKRFARQVKDQSTNQVIDGFVKRPAAVVRATRARKPAKTVHNRTERSKTLVRNAVKRPTSTETKSSLSKSSPHPATTIIKNAKVRRFGELPSKTQSSSSESLASRASTNASAVTPAFPASMSHQRLERMLDEALIRADAHKNMLARSSKNPVKLALRHIWMSTMILVAIVLAGGYLAWRTVPAFSMMVSARRVGLSSSLPSYTPDSFKVTAPVTYGNGALNIHYASRVNKTQNYTLTEKKSNWDSASMAANVIGKNTNVQTSQIGGTTVYTYGAENDAAWVNNGIWYTVVNHASLTSNQLLQIAENM